MIILAIIVHLVFYVIFFGFVAYLSLFFYFNFIQPAKEKHQRIQQKMNNGKELLTHMKLKKYKLKITLLVIL